MTNSQILKISYFYNLENIQELKLNYQTNNKNYFLTIENLHDKIKKSFYFLCIRL